MSNQEYPYGFPKKNEKDVYDWQLFAWTIDFIRCFEEMPKWRKMLLRFVLGKHAAREYVGAREYLDGQNENQSQFGYGLEGCDYHNENWRWLK